MNAQHVTLSSIRSSLGRHVRHTLTALALMLIHGSVLLAGPVNLISKSPMPSEEVLPPYLYDRGRGIPTSLFGSFVAEDEFWMYAFYEYVLERRFDYNPADFDLGEDEDFIGKGKLHQYLVFFGWGITEDLMLEVEGSLYDHQTVERAAADRGPGSRAIVEEGLGTVEGQLRYRVIDETPSIPDLYLFTGWELPLQKSEKFIGASEWELFYGFGVVKGFSFGTFHVYVTPLVWLPESNEKEFGGFGIDYIKRINDNWRVVVSAESSGTDEWSAIGEVQYHVSDRLYLKFNCGFGLTKNEPAIAPEVGVMFRF